MVVPAGVTTPEQARPYFDSFSWQSFIALNWPADPVRRGQPKSPDDPGAMRRAAAGAPTVWGTYKEAYELFGQKAERPTPWDSFLVPVPACPSASESSKVLVMASKMGSLLDEVNQAFSFPLIDQSGNYARSEVRFNRAQYDFVRGDDGHPEGWLYRKANLQRYWRSAASGGAPLGMPASAPPSTQGAIMIKATWREMTPKDDPSRYYVVDAQMVSTSTNRPGCETHRMGLVGLHIAQKLAAFPQWIWSSFEQVDNVERGPGATPQTPISFNNGRDWPPTQGGWTNRPPKAPPFQDASDRVPVQVTRLNPIPTTPPGNSTRDLNARFQQLLAGTVWSHYQLVITQWPTQPERFKVLEAGGTSYPGDCGQPFPVSGCVNVSMETFFQSANDAQAVGGNSCMACHYVAGQSDFSWVLQNRSH